METIELDSRIKTLKIEIEKLVLDFNKETSLNIDYLQIIPLMQQVGSITPKSYQVEIVFKY